MEGIQMQVVTGLKSQRRHRLIQFSMTLTMGLSQRVYLLVEEKNMRKKIIMREI